MIKKYLYLLYDVIGVCVHAKWAAKVRKSLRIFAFSHEKKREKAAKREKRNKRKDIIANYALLYAIVVHSSL